MTWSNHRCKGVLHSIWKGCSLHGNKPNASLPGASLSLLNTWFSPTADSHIHEISETHHYFINPGPKDLRFTLTFLAGQELYWMHLLHLKWPQNSQSAQVPQEWAPWNETSGRACITPGCLGLLELDGKRREWDTQVCPFIPLLERGKPFNQWAQINQPDSHLGFEFDGTLWIGWKIFTSLCKSVFVNVLVSPLITREDHSFL